MESNDKSQITTTKNDPITRTLAKTPYPAWTMATLCLGSSGLAARNYPGLPSVWTVIGFSLMFSLSGYMTYVGDFSNGAGTSTSWSLIYSLFNVERSIKSRKPLPIVMSSLALSNAYVYGKYYFF
ncbi:altered inheritance of mitochondria protein 19 [Glomus cerebriforme]|uniref:Altered inheritance of mitochondria protein 19 n=1 Tax=Glomus cerebriforme TaxID=658196 RepID=A0A397TD63_9GLOM|nr:altered inheritance of mitochondria protein 19 [Glomus cerebriforme]